MVGGWETPNPLPEVSAYEQQKALYGVQSTILRGPKRVDK
jgi:hypothetical protein